MKKLSAILTAVILSVSLTACSSATDNNSNTDNIDSAAYRVGIGSYTTTDSSYSSVEGENGRGVISTTYATVIFDSNDIIRKVYIDQVESKIHFDSKGQIVTNGTTTDIRTKRELGDEYGMKAASPIGKEWYEQVNSIESWLVGKNIKDITSGAMNNMYDNSYPDNATGDMGTAASDIVNGAKNIAGDVVRGAESVVSDITNGMTDSNSVVGGMNDSTNDEALDGTIGGPSSGTENNMNNSNSAVNNTVNWGEDLKAVATIDTTDIQIALRKAYDNAR